MRGPISPFSFSSVHYSSKSELLHSKYTTLKFIQNAYCSLDLYQCSLDSRVGALPAAVSYPERAVPDAA